MKVEKILDIIKAYHETLEDGSNVVPMYNWNPIAVDLYQLASESNDIHNVSDLLFAFLEYGKERHYTPLTQGQMKALIKDFEANYKR